MTEIEIHKKQQQHNNQHNNSRKENTHSLHPLTSPQVERHSKRGRRREKARATAATTHCQEFVCLREFERENSASINQQRECTSKQASKRGWQETIRAMEQERERTLYQDIEGKSSYHVSSWHIQQKKKRRGAKSCTRSLSR
jgi:hypothetical protein